MQQIPLGPVPSQTLQVSLGNQLCQINVYQRLSGLYVDLFLSGVLVIGGVLAQNANRIVRSLYLGFTGDLAFLDTQGTSDPDYTGLGGRFAFVWLEPADLLGQG